MPIGDEWLENQREIIREHFHDLCTLYKPVELARGADKRNQGNTHQLVGTGIACQRIKTMNQDIVTALGLTNQQTLLTTDAICFALEQDVDNEYALTFDTVGDPDYGKWYTIQGDTKVLGTFFKIQMAYIKISTVKPIG